MHRNSWVHFIRDRESTTHFRSIGVQKTVTAMYNWTEHADADVENPLGWRYNLNPHEDCFFLSFEKFRC